MVLLIRVAYDDAMMHLARVSRSHQREETNSPTHPNCRDRVSGVRQNEIGTLLGAGGPVPCYLSRRTEGRSREYARRNSRARTRHSVADLSSILYCDTTASETSCDIRGRGCVPTRSVGP